MINTKNRSRFIFYICLSFILTYALFKFFHVEGVYYLFPLVMLGVIYLTDRAFKIKNEKIFKVSFWFSLFIAATFVIGRNANTSLLYFESFDYKDLFYFLFLFILFYIATSVISDFITDKAGNLESENNLKPTKYLLYFGIIFVAWLPYYLVYYPGCFSFDSFYSLKQIFGLIEYSNWQPILYTATVKFFVDTGALLGGDINFGLGLASLAQMACLAATLSYLCFYLRQKGVPKGCCFAFVLFFALNPVIALYSVTFWKDIYFACFLLLFTVMINKVISSKGDYFHKPLNIVFFITVSLFIAFARNNGVFILAITFIALIFSYRKKLKILLPVFIFILLVIFIITGPIFNAIGIEKTMIEESLAIPLQQIGYTLSIRGRITSPQQEFIGKILPLDIYKEVYCPTSIDPVKMRKEFDSQFLQDNFGEFIKTWFQILLKNPGAYIKAYCMQTKGYWCIDTINWVNIYEVSENNLGVFNTDIINKMFGIDLKPLIYSFTETLRNSQLFGDVFNIALSFVLCLYSCVLAIIRKGKNVWLRYIPLFALWLSIMIATPVYCEFRYMLAFHLALPLVISDIFYCDKNNNKVIRSL